MTGRLERWLVRIWYGKAGPADRLIAALLSPLGLPLSLLVAAVARRRRRRIVRQDALARPVVVVVGNLVAGGAGKTPTTIGLARALVARGHRVGLLARGYQRRDGGMPLLVAPDTPAALAGDEPLLLAQSTGLPVAVAADRAAALARLNAAHPDLTVVLSDDGLQHVRLPRRVELVVVDGRGFGNGRCLPAGPLREPVDRLESVDGIVLHDRASLSASLPRGSAGRADGQAEAAGTAPAGGRQPLPPQFRLATGIGRFRALDDGSVWAPEAFATLLRGRGATVAAMAGIADPERFFRALDALGIDIQRHPLADHATIDSSWIETLDHDWVVMTAKDAVKLPGGFQRGPRRVVAEQQAMLDEALINWLCDRLPPARGAA